MKLNLILAQINTIPGCIPANLEKHMALTKTEIDLNQLQRTRPACLCSETNVPNWCSVNWKEFYTNKTPAAIPRGASLQSAAAWMSPGAFYGT
jgi:hypothetical protein